MRVQITERHCSVTDAVLERAEERIAKLDKFDGRATHAEVVFSEEKSVRRAEGRVHVDRGSPVIAHGEGADFRSALDQLIDRLGRQLKKQHDRRRDHQATPLSEALEGE